VSQSSENFNTHATHPLQTWEWGEFRKKWGNEVYRTDSYQLTIHPLPIAKHLKVATLIRGPKPTKKMFGELIGFAKKNNLLFIKIEPNILQNTKDEKLLKKYGCIKGKTLFTPSSFWIDLTKSEEDLLKSFHSKTRYNIKVAGRHGVLVKEDNSDQTFEEFLELYKETTQRQGFYAHNETYFRLMWNTLHTEMIKNKKLPIARIIKAEYQKQTLATWVLFVWKDFLYYPYGASTDKHKEVMASSLMMWEAIKLGKSLNLKTFDLWGREQGKGFTKFKEGFNPQVVEFVGTWDLPTSPLYRVFRLADSTRWSILRATSKFIKPKF